MLLVGDEPAREAVSEQVTPAPVLDVEALGVATVQLTHPVGEVPARALHHEVVMGAHQAQGVDLPCARLDDLEQERQERPAIVVVEVDQSVLDAPGRYVVDPVGEQRSG